MQIKPGYILRNVLDMYVVMGIGREAYQPNRIMSVNETGAFLWGLLEKGAEREELVAKMHSEYEVDPATAAADVDAFLAQLMDKGLVQG